MEHPEEKILLPLDTHLSSEEHTIVGEELPTGSSPSSNFSLKKNQGCPAEPAPAQPGEPSSPFPQRNEASESSLSASEHELTTVPATPPSADPSPSPSEELVFPPGIEPAFALTLIATLSGRNQRQAVLDELAGRLQTGRVRYPYGYLKALVERAQKGVFIPDAALPIAEARRRRAILREAEVAPPKYLAPSPPPLPSGRLGKALERLSSTLKDRALKGRTEDA